jgi:hypothetical protein
MVHNYSRTTIAIILLVALLLTATVAIVAGAEGEEIEVTCGTSGLDPLSREKAMGSGPFCRLGQRLTIPNRLVTQIGYRVWKWGNPTGDVTLSIRDLVTDKPIVSVVWGDASELPGPDAGGIRKVRLSEPVRVNGEVIICVEYYGGNMTDYCLGGYRTGNYRDGETYMNYDQTRGNWHDIGPAEEGGYFYAYIDEGSENSSGENGSTSGDNGASEDNGTNWLVIGLASGIPVAGAGFAFYYTKKRRKRHS